MTKTEPPIQETLVEKLQELRRQLMIDGFHDDGNTLGEAIKAIPAYPSPDRDSGRPQASLEGLVEKLMREKSHCRGMLSDDVIDCCANIVRAHEAAPKAATPDVKRIEHAIRIAALEHRHGLRGIAGHLAEAATEAFGDSIATIAPVSAEPIVQSITPTKNWDTPIELTERQQGYNEGFADAIKHFKGPKPGTVTTGDLKAEVIGEVSQPQRCKHDVWAYDHCYACEAEADKSKQQPVGVTREEAVEIGEAFKKCPEHKWGVTKEWHYFFWGWHSHKPEREVSCPPPEMGMHMEDVRVGMKMKSLYGGPVITVTELTDRGFRYSHPAYHLGTRIGQTTGGEHYGHNGYSHYTQLEPAPPTKE